MGRLQLGAFAVLAALLAGSPGCGQVATPPEANGSLALDLELPPAGDLRPANMTTVAVSVTTTEGIENITTTPLTGMTFTAGDVMVGDPVTVGAELHDQTDRLVGFGRNDTPVTPDHTAQTVKIDVRKPFVYLSSSGPIQTIDTTLDVLDPKYQGALASAGTLAIPIDGTEMAVINGATLQRVTTADHKPTGGSIDLRATVLDAAAVPGKRQVVAATATSLVIVDIDAGTTMALPVSTKPDRIAIGGSADTGFIAYVLSNRVAPPQGATGTCSGASTVTAVPLGGGASSSVGKSESLADIAASGDAVFGANPCTGTVARLDGGSPALQLTLAGASSVAVEGVRLWAAGSAPPAGTQGAQIVLASVQLDGTDPQTVKLAAKSERMTYDGDDKGELSLDIAADTEVVLDLAVLPGAQTVAVIAKMDSTRAARGDSLGDVIPAMKATVYDLVLADTKTGAVRRIRSKCTLMITSSGAEFQMWSCGPLAAEESPAGGEMIPAAVSALYGGR